MAASGLGRVQMARWRAGFEEFTVASTARFGRLHPLVFGTLLASLPLAALLPLALVMPTAVAIALYAGARIKGGNHEEAVLVLHGERSWRVPSLCWEQGLTSR
jgi:hypothetical protein